MRALVTGGAGFIGSHLCDALLARGDAVTCLDDLSGPDGMRNIVHLLPEPRFEFWRYDLTDCELDLAGFDVVFHLACTSLPVSMADPVRDLRTNGLGTLRLLEAVVRAKVGKYIHASTGSVFGEPEGIEDEDHPTRPTSFYGVSKLAGESYVRVMGALHGIDYAVLRYYNVVGPRQDAREDGGVVPVFINRALARLPITIHGSGEQVRCFTSVHDIVAANLLAAERGHGFYNVGSGSEATINLLAAYVMDELGEVPIVHAPPRPGDIFALRVDNERIRALGMSFEMDWRVPVREVIESLMVPA